MPIFKDINQKLYSACVGNDAKKVEEYLKSKKVDPNWQNKEELNQSAIHIACSKGYVNVVKALVAGGADVNLADDENVSPLHKAARSGHMDTIQCLLDAKVDVNAINGKTQSSVLFNAAKEGNVPLVKALLHHQADVNLGSIATGQSPLSIAARNGQVKIVGLLLKAEAHVNAVSLEGQSALFEASLKGHVRVVESLLQFNADVNLANKEGVTPLAAAAAEGHAMVSKILIVARADVNRRDNHGYSALYRACEKNNGKIVEQLIEAGASLDGLNQTSPLYIATANGHTEIVSLIVNAARIDALKSKKSVLSTKHSLQKVKSLLKVIDGPRGATPPRGVKRSVTFLESDQSIVDILTSNKNEGAVTTSEEKTCDVGNCTVS